MSDETTVWRDIEEWVPACGTIEVSISVTNTDHEAASETAQLLAQTIHNRVSAIEEQGGPHEVNDE